MLALAAGAHAYAQNDVDALRYSQLTFAGSARFASMAGSFGALGGDASTFSFNPAGIAVYRKNELSLTPSFYSAKTSSTYNGTNSSDSKFNFNFSHLGLTGAFVNKENDANNSGWVNVNVGFAYNRTNNFHNRIDIFGRNDGNTFVDEQAALANGSVYTDLDPFNGALFFGSGLIDTMAGDPRSYYSVIGNIPVTQHKSIETTGAMTETVITLGGNYANKLYLGATLGIPRIRFEEESYYEEEDDRDSIYAFDKYRYYNHLATKGNGFNFKVGMIYRITDWMRIGGAIHTPSFFSMHDEYDNRVSVEFDDISSSYDTISPKGAFDYRLTTPMRAIGSLALLYKKQGLINIDYEFVDYTSSRFRSSPNVFYEVNPVIKEKYMATSNIRVGAEYRLDPIALRAGYAMYGSPFKTGVNLNEAARNSITAGIGFRQDDYYIDLGYVLTKYSENYYLYNPEITNPVKNDFTTSNFLVTVGWRY